jgi:uncharacterized protein YutE (UPF0331/DUF86 family)/predicted nucleotidyltransferase
VNTIDQLEAELREVCSRFTGIRFAFLFGSAVSGRLRPDSDIDIAVYGDSGGMLELEADRFLDDETDMQLAFEHATNRNVDLLILNRAPATVCSAALLMGRPLVIRDGSLYSRFFLAVTSVAMDFLETSRDYRRIRDRSASLSEIDRERLERIIEFIQEELLDRNYFREMSPHQYRSDRNERRNFDRWVEVLINATIDAAKIILASEHMSTPQTYGQILEQLEELPHFTQLSGRLKILAPLRNVLAHEYLDLRFTRIRKFAEADADTLNLFVRLLKDWIISY